MSENGSVEFIRAELTEAIAWENRRDELLSALHKDVSAANLYAWDAHEKKWKHEWFQAALAQIEQLDSELQDWRDSHRRIIDEPCREDERHCTCVPALRTEIDRLSLAVEFESLAKEHRDHIISERDAEIVRLRSLLPQTADGVLIADCESVHCPRCGKAVQAFAGNQGVSKYATCFNCTDEPRSYLNLHYSECLSKPKE